MGFFRGRLGTALLCLGAGFVLFSLCFGRLVIWPGTKVAGIPVGGLTPSAAKVELARKLLWDTRKILLCSDDFALEVYLQKDLGVNPNIEKTLRLCTRTLWSHIGHKELPLVAELCRHSLDDLASRLGALLDSPPQNATLRVTENEQVEIVPGLAGRTFDRNQMREKAASYTGMFYIPKRMEIPVHTVEPQISEQDLQAFLPITLIAEHSTAFQDGNDRAHNIRLAAAAVSNIALFPGQVFSFNLATGPRSKENGYRKAPVIVGEDFVDDYGGGVCQVSTTLYVAMLKADLSIWERHCHGIPVSYVPMGMDATVAYDLLDLKMVNESQSLYLTFVTAQEGRLAAKIFGKDKSGLKIEIETSILKEFPPEVPETDPDDQEFAGGSKLRSGYLVETRRKYITEDGVARSQLLGTSMYPPQKQAALSPKGSS